MLAGNASPAEFFDLFGLAAWNELSDRYRNDGENRGAVPCR
jgi:hypothetical protein